VELATDSTSCVWVQLLAFVGAPFCAGYKFALVRICSDPLGLALLGFHTDIRNFVSFVQINPFVKMFSGELRRKKWSLHTPGPLQHHSVRYGVLFRM